MSARGFTVGDNYGGVSSSSADGWQHATFVRYLTRGGYVVTESNGRPWNHRVAGMPGIAHDDARWCETRFAEGSMAAYHENGAADGSRWFAPSSPFDATAVRYYGARPRRGAAARSHAYARHDYLRATGQHNATACPWDAYGTCE